MSEEQGKHRKELRSKGLLPAVGVGAAVYFFTGLVSISTLSLVGVGAGVGYGIGGWLADAYQKRQEAKGGVAVSADSPGGEQLPWAMQVSLQAWQAYLRDRTGGAQLTPDGVEQIFADFAQQEPLHAANVRALVHAGVGQQAGQSSGGGMGATPVFNSAGAFGGGGAAEV